MTIAQAIEESAWGQSGLAAQYHNLFGIKGTGPAGSVSLPTSEYEGGQWVTIDAQFRVYHNDAESIADHAELLATSGYYTRAMADRAVPDAFANDLTGVYATDPDYGANLIALMKLYNLYQFDTAGGPAPATPRRPPARPPRRPPARRPRRQATWPRHRRPPRPAPPATTPAPSAQGNPAAYAVLRSHADDVRNGGGKRRRPPGRSRAWSPRAGWPRPLRLPPRDSDHGDRARRIPGPSAGTARQPTAGRWHGYAARVPPRRRGAARPRFPGWSPAPGSSPRRASPGHARGQGARQVPGAAPARRDDRALRQREGAARPGRAPLPRRRRLHRRRLGAARRRRLDAVQGGPALLPRARGEARIAQRRRDHVSYEVGRLDPVRLRPRRAHRRGIRDRPHGTAPAVGARARRRVRRVPVGRTPPAARRLPHGVPLLRGRPHRTAPEDALAAH